MTLSVNSCNVPVFHKIIFWTATLFLQSIPWLWLCIQKIFLAPLASFLLLGHSRTLWLSEEVLIATKKWLRLVKSKQNFISSKLINSNDLIVHYLVYLFHLLGINGINIDIYGGKTDIYDRNLDTYCRNPDINGRNPDINGRTLDNYGDIYLRYLDIYGGCLDI